MSGWEKLGDLIGGGAGGGNTSEAYVQGVTQGHKARGAMYDADKAREAARIERSMAIAREAIPDAVAEAEYAENQQALVSALLQASRSPNLNNLGKLQVPGAGAAYQAASAAAGEGNTDVQNRQTALATGKAYEPFELGAGGKAVFNPGSGDVDLTPIGDVAVDATRAQANQRNASAVASGARTDLTNDRRENPEKYRAPPKGKADAAPKPPKAGDVVDGWRFKGGDAGDKANWTKV